MSKNGAHFCKFISNYNTHKGILFCIRWIITDQIRINPKKEQQIDQDQAVCLACDQQTSTQGSSLLTELKIHFLL